MMGNLQTIVKFCLIAQTTVLAVAKATVPISLGCYQDNPPHSPVLVGPATSATEMTVQRCLAFCTSSGHKYAGVVNSYGCRCGDQFQGDTAVSRRLQASDCTAPCGGDQSQFCGGLSGSQKMEVFEAFIEASIVACGGNLNNDSGTIYSPNFPESYLPSQNCTWNIQVHPENVIRVILELSELSPDDSLIITESESSQRVNKVPNKTLDPSVEYISASNIISVQFRTKPQGEQQAGRFFLRYEAVGRCEAIPTDSRVVSVSPPLALIGQRVTVTCQDRRAVAVECQKNRRFDVLGPYCTETGFVQVQVSTIVAVTVAAILVVSCSVNAFFIFKRRRQKRIVEDSEIPDHDYEEIPDVLEMKNFSLSALGTLPSACEFLTNETGADYQEVIPVTTTNREYTSLALNSSTLARAHETATGGESEKKNFTPITLGSVSISSSSKILDAESELDYQVLIPETMENNVYTSLAWDSSLAREC
ncbi:PREDICTED: kremen protein 2-like [Branchiostoma belcheri]|uniref:Kremen protein 2-like n=1 Tax=Branchiostoma belcheri TaxID=7741 RepID=A0A6P4ZR12_BRABE|nr:PREDICTED: kremen protein 2-like [Branchiostoma belcheri]